MNGEEMKRIRHKLGLSVVRLGRAIGYEGQDNTVTVTMRRYESNARPIPPWIARLLLMFEKHGVPRGWAATLPRSMPTDGSAETPDEQLEAHLDSLEDSKK